MILAMHPMCSNGIKSKQIKAHQPQPHGSRPFRTLNLFRISKHGPRLPIGGSLHPVNEIPPHRLKKAASRKSCNEIDRIEHASSTVVNMPVRWSRWQDGMTEWQGDIGASTVAQSGILGLRYWSVEDVYSVQYIGTVSDPFATFCR